MVYVSVRNGTRAGWKKTMQEASVLGWVCEECGHANKPFYANCWECGKHPHE